MACPTKDTTSQVRIAGIITGGAVAQTFKDLDKIDLYTPLISLVDAIPAFSPQTTLANSN